MFSVQQKRDIAEAVQGILRATNHPELPKEEIQFQLQVNGGGRLAWAVICNNGAVLNPDSNPWNEKQDPNTKGQGEASGSNYPSARVAEQHFTGKEL